MNSDTHYQHIRVVPRVKDEPGEAHDRDHKSGIPIFRSLSLLTAARTGNHNTPAAQDIVSEPIAHAKTFADMARRICMDKITSENVSMSQASSSLAGIIKFQPNHSWRQVQPKGHGGLSAPVRGIDDFSPVTKESASFLAHAKAASFQGTAAGSTALPTVEYAPSNILSHADSFGRPVRVPGMSEHIHKSPFQLAVEGQPLELFGKLPDPIYLHEQLGEFDGQVVFIGHPNRDISAHQWSSPTFQWENIGRYAHARNKIEGSLASDRLNQFDEPHNTLVYFKHAAENRAKNVPARRILDFEAFSEVATPAKGSLHTKGKRELLDDPFVAEASSLGAVISAHVHPESRTVDAKGSLDLEYQFPARSTALSDNLTVAPITREQIPQFEREAWTTTRCGTNAERMSQPALDDISLGEETSGEVFPKQGFTYRNLHLLVQKALHDRTKFEGPVSASDLQAQGSFPTSRYGTVQPSARSLFPSLGPTIANPRRIVRPQSIAVTDRAIDVRQAKTPQNGESEGATASIRFSEPDGLCRDQEYEIANGLNQQAPTVQKFKGPFFAASKPTASDPTASLSVHIGEEEKLLAWFCDGHRPARQREYAMTLVSGATTGGRCLGIIGETMRATHNGDYENTGPFVRLYEGLSEYIEEFHNGIRESYFNRAWRAAPSHLRDFDMNANSSYFTATITTSSKLH